MSFLWSCYVFYYIIFCIIIKSPSQSPIAWLDNSRLSNCKKQNDITKKPRSPIAPAQQVKTLICLQSIKISWQFRILGLDWHVKKSIYHTHTFHIPIFRETFEKRLKAQHVLSYQIQLFTSKIGLLEDF